MFQFSFELICTSFEISTPSETLNLVVSPIVKIGITLVGCINGRETHLYKSLSHLFGTICLENILL